MDLKPNKSLTKWLNIATPAQRKLLARFAKTSLPHLQHVAHGRRAVSADLAQRIAHAAATIGIGIGEGLLPSLYQQDLCDACRRCPLVSGAR